MQDKCATQHSVQKALESKCADIKNRADFDSFMELLGLNNWLVDERGRNDIKYLYIVVNEQLKRVRLWCHWKTMNGQEIVTRFISEGVLVDVTKPEEEHTNDDLSEI